MPAAHVFNVPQKYSATGDAAAAPPREKRSKFRWFGHGMRLSKHPSSQETAVPSRRSKSGYISTDDEFTPSPRASKSLTSESDLGAHDSSKLIKFGLLRRHHQHHHSDNNSLRSSIASTASTSTTLSDDLSPPSSTASCSSPVDDELHSPRMDSETRELLRDVVGVDVTWTDAAHVARHFESIQWRVVRIEADGNCLFRAVSDQIYRNEAFYGDIRRRVVEYIEREKELFQPFVENEQAGLFEPIDAYCTRMKQDGQWGGNPELYAVARLFNVHIVVHQGPMRRLRIESGRAESPDMEMHLLFRNDHYDSLHDESQLDHKPRLSASIPDELVVQTTEEDVSETIPVDNQKEEEPVAEDKKKTKKKKCVVFIGEQTRVERVEVELPHVVVHAPVRLVVRGGKVCTSDETIQMPVEDHQEDNQVSECAEAAPRSEQCDASAAQPAPVESPTDGSSNNNQDTDLPVVRVKRVNFRRGRRVLE